MSEMLDISDFCQHPGCHNRTAIWCEGIAACAQHEDWLEQKVNKLLKERKGHADLRMPKPR